MTDPFMTALKYHRLLQTQLPAVSSSLLSDPSILQEPTSGLQSPHILSHDQIIRVYERARFHKLYGLTPLDEEIPSKVWHLVRTHACQNGDAPCEIEFHLFLQTDHFTPTSPAVVDRFLHSAGHLLFENIAFRTHGTAASKILSITTTHRHVEHLLRIAEFAPLIYINYVTLGESIAIHTINPRYASQIRLTGLLVPATCSYPKNPHSDPFIPPNPDFLFQCVPAIYSWIHDRMTTTIRAEKIGYRYELRFYRHSYTDGEKLPLRYTTPTEITREIARGAFCWIPDTHLTTTPDDIDSAESITFTGPLYATIDIDAGSSVSFGDVVASAQSFTTFLHDTCKITPHFLTSGNRSLHLRFELSYPTEDERGYLLPKITQWTTYYRRRHCEFPVQTVRDALLILLCAYNECNRAHPVGCDIPAYQRYKSRLFFDLRCGLHQGARIPGSYHQKSNRYCALIPHLFENELEVIQYSTEEYLATHPEALFHPSITDSDRHANLSRLLAFTNDWYDTHLAQLLENHIFHGITEGE